MDRLDVACWAGCIVGVAAWLYWWVRDVQTYPPRPAVISHYRT